MSSTNYHTPKAADGTTMEAADVNSPLGELDAAITANVASILANAGVGSANAADIAAEIARATAAEAVNAADIAAEIARALGVEQANAAAIATNAADIQALGGSGLGDWGGANASEFFLLSHWLDAIGRPAGSPTYNDDGVITAMNVTWPDGTSGVYTATTVDDTWFEATAWTLTHSASSQTVTASGLVRNSDGEITTPLSFSVS